MVVLTSLGEGARRYVTGEFQALGTDLVIVLPGRSETTGVQPGLFAGETPRDLTLGDAQALLRIPEVARIAPIVVGSAPISAGELSREVPVIGTSSDFITVRSMTMGQGRFLPEGGLDRRFRVIGVLSDSGRAIGFDTQELVIIPVTSAQQLFDTESLFRILIQARDPESMDRVREQVRATLAARHQGEEDVTVITQDPVLATFNRIFTALTLTLAGIASISLAVAGILIMNVMLVAVSQRTAEVGLLKALGARGRQITALFLAEAVLLSMAGAAPGLAFGYVANWLIGRAYPALPVGAPASIRWWHSWGGAEPCVPSTSSGSPAARCSHTACARCSRRSAASRCWWARWESSPS